MTNIIFFGPPGAGKGTQAKILSSFLKLPHLSTGDILRSKIKLQDTLALKVKEIIASGKLVPDEILNEIVSDKLIKDCNQGFILDGYPRTLEQGIFLDNFLETNDLKIDFIFDIFLEYKILEKRIINRSKEENREDDNQNILMTRFEEYKLTTQKITEHYEIKYRNKYFKIDGNNEISKITSEIKKIIGNTWFS